MPASALAALLLLSAVRATPQTAARPASVRELGGYMLNQYAKGVEKGLGTPIRTNKDSSGAALLQYALTPEDKTHITFSISENEEGTEPGEDTRRVTRIRIAGEPHPGLQGIHGIALGDARAKVVERLGAPDSSEPSGTGEELDWKDRNFSVFMNAAGRVGGIEIVEDADLFPKMGDSKPDVAGFREALQGRDRETILQWIAADLDLYTKDDDVVGIVGSPRETIFNEESLVARYLFGGTGSVRDLLSAELVSKAEEERDEDEPTTWYTTFPEGSSIGRVLWTFEAGRWRVWDVDLAPFETRRSATGR